jgi:hypothetical protein
MFTLNWKSVLKGLAVAVFAGAILPIAAMVQTPGFDFTQVDLNGILVLAINGALVGFTSYLTKEFFTDHNGKFMGKI